MKKIRLLVVDDSTYTLFVIRKMISSVPDIEVVGQATNGEDAVALANSLKPDVITMDVGLPTMDGVTATRTIMAQCPTSIIMVSAHTQEGAHATVDAMAAGAVDFIPKMEMTHKILVDKIQMWGNRSVKPAFQRPTAEPAPTTAGCRPCPSPKGMDLVVVGVSTGGPTMFLHMLTSTGKLRAPMVVAQHMPASYTKFYADRLKRDSGLDVCEGSDGMILRPGTVTILPGNVSSIVRPGAAGTFILCVSETLKANVHPNADILFESAAKVAKRPVAVILTGMGNDGTQGSQFFADRNLPVLAQSPADCVVDGMPSRAIAAGTVSHILCRETIGRTLQDWDRG
jgi:two-component system, chemotaxis family, protein-glutamate methylesterase/glutaminase